jgi:uncharacterized membrane protein (UPF0127 family)
MTEKQSTKPVENIRTVPAAFMCGFFARLRGLAFRKTYPFSFPCFFPHCRWIHSVGMRFALDAVFLDQAGVIIRIYSNAPPFRILGCPSACAVLEMPAGQARHLRLEIGQKILLQEQIRF